MVGHAQEPHVLLMVERIVSDSVLHDTECPPEVEFHRLIALSVGADSKFAAGSLLRCRKCKPITTRDKDRIEDFFTLSEPVDRASSHPAKQYTDLGRDDPSMRLTVSSVSLRMPTNSSSRLRRRQVNSLARDAGRSRLQIDVLDRIRE